MILGSFIIHPYGQSIHYSKNVYCLQFRSDYNYSIFNYNKIRHEIVDETKTSWKVTYIGKDL